MRNPLTGTSPFGWVAVPFALIGISFLFVTLTGPSKLLWIGHPVHGSEQDGIVYYQYRGVTYTKDDTGSYANESRTVYIDTSNPDDAFLYTIGGRMEDLLLVGVPFLGAIAFLIAGFVRKARNARKRRAFRAAPLEASYGTGLDPQLVARLMASRDQAHRPRRQDWSGP